MTRNYLLTITLSFVLVSATAARAGAQETGSAGGHGPGVGVEETLGGLTGATFVYDLDKFHIDVIFGLEHNSNVSDTIFGIGGRFFFLIHKGDRADFGVGGGVAVVHEDRNNAGETNIQIEGGAQIRVWLTSNVNLNATLGLAFVTADNAVLLGGPVIIAQGDSALGIGGQLAGGLGITYFFK